MTATKPRGRPFRPGTSGNPKGRPASSTTIAKLRASIAKDIPDIIAKQVELAKAGDAQAARLLLERVLPPVRASEQPMPISMPAEGLVDQGRAVMAAAGAGELAPGQASQLLTGLASLAKLIETEELEKRLTVLEGRQPT
jgi:hypothetical protein